MGNNDTSKEQVEKKLDALRQQIDAADSAIINALGRRKQVEENLVSIEKGHPLPNYHPPREENLISDRRKQAVEKGMDPDQVEELFRAILRHSRADQTSRLSRQAAKPGARILIVGGRGSMGRYFHRWFEAAGYPVGVLDREDWSNVEKLTRQIDLALVSVPIESTAEVISSISPFLPPDCILADITSVKVSPMASMMAAHPGPVLGLHPLFGPSTSMLDKQIIVVTPGRDSDASRWVVEQLSTWGSIILQSTAKEHDEMMGIVQTLRHFATFAFGQFLHGRQVSLQRTLEFSSPIYRLELGMVGRLFAQDPALYAEIIFASPDRRKLLKEYLASIQKNLDMIEKGEKDLFQAEFRKIADWFGPFSEQAMRESSFLIDKLIERF